MRRRGIFWLRLERKDVVICELMLVEVFLKLCNGNIFKHPMGSREAGAYCQRLRENRRWRLVESVPVMSDVWRWTGRRDFAFRRIIDIRLGLALRHFGVEEFATTNAKDFRALGFKKYGTLWTPVPSEDKMISCAETRTRRIRVRAEWHWLSAHAQ